MNNHTDDETTDRSDEIISDMISLIHATTHSSYVTCSQLSSRLIAYFSQTNIHDNQWNDMEKAVEVMNIFEKDYSLIFTFVFSAF